MIKIEELGQTWNIHIRAEQPAQEFALVVCGLMKYLKPEEMHRIIDQAIEHQEEFDSITRQQLSLFNLRLSHLMELHGTNLKELIKDVEMTEGDAYDITHGSAPSLDCIQKICKRFGVDKDYLFKAYETDCGTDKHI